MLATILSASLLILNVLDTLKLLKRPKPRVRTVVRAEDGAAVPVAAKRRISTHKREQMRGMLMLWVTWNCTRLIIALMDDWISWLPFFSYFRSGIFVYLLLTRSFGGGIIYRKIIAPNLDKYSQSIDLAIELILLLLRWNVQLALLVTLVPLMASWSWIVRQLRPSRISVADGPPSTPTSRSISTSKTPPRTITSNLLAFGRSTPHFSQALSEARAIFNTIEGRRSAVRGKAEELKGLRERSTMRKRVARGGGKVGKGESREERDVDVEEELRLDSVRPIRQMGTAAPKPKVVRVRSNITRSFDTTKPAKPGPATMDVSSIYPQLPEIAQSNQHRPPQISPPGPLRYRHSAPTIPAIRQEMKDSRARVNGPSSSMVPGGFRLANATTALASRVTIQDGPAIQENGIIDQRQPVKPIQKKGPISESITRFSNGSTLLPDGHTSSSCSSSFPSSAISIPISTFSPPHAARLGKKKDETFMKQIHGIRSSDTRRGGFRENSRGDDFNQHRGGDAVVSVRDSETPKVQNESNRRDQANRDSTLKATSDSIAQSRTLKRPASSSLSGEVSRKKRVVIVAARAGPSRRPKEVPSVNNMTPPRRSRRLAAPTTLHENNA